MAISVSKVRNIIETESKYCYKNLKRKKTLSLIVGGRIEMELETELETEIETVEFSVTTLSREHWRVK